MLTGSASGSERRPDLPHRTTAAEQRHSPRLRDLVEVHAVEVLEPSPKLRSMIVRAEPLGELVAQAKTEGFVPIIEDGLRHVAAGRTTVSEMVRVLSFEERALDLYEEGEN